MEGERAGTMIVSLDGVGCVLHAHSGEVEAIMLDSLSARTEWTTAAMSGTRVWPKSLLVCQPWPKIRELFFLFDLKSTKGVFSNEHEK